MRLVLALSKPSLTRMRAVASKSVSTVRRERSCEADFLGFVCIFLAINTASQCEWKKRMIAHILALIEITGKCTNLRGHDMHDTLQRLFRYKAWANDELLTALATLGGEAPVTKLAIKALSHSHVVDQIFAAQLWRQGHAYTSANLSEMPGLEDLSADIRTTDQAYIDYVSELERGHLAEEIDFAFTDGAPGRMSREEMLLHVITHGVGHRGQVSAVMLLNAVAPANDGFTTYLHKAEAATRRRAT
jgi:uncharacterized damage-inducible protein DinB